jgi:hypothetical protein
MIFGFFGGEKKRAAELIEAARTGNTEKAKQLLSKGVDINASEPESGDTPLLAAIDKGQWETAEYLLTQEPDLTRGGQERKLTPVFERVSWRLCHRHGQNAP